MLRLTARTLAACIPVNIEWLEDARNAQAVIVNALQSAMGLMLDQAALFGLGAAAEPRGIINTPNVNEIPPWARSQPMPKCRKPWAIF